ncbi:MAG: chromosomal replication initiator protein DnaA [Actinomycetota bacterium]
MPAPDVIWKEASSHLRHRLSEGTFSAWFNQSDATGLDAGTLTLTVPNPFTKDWIESRYVHLIREIVSAAAGHPLEVAVLSRDESPPAPAEDTIEPGPGLTPSQAHAPTNPRPHPYFFHPKYTFDSFVIGSSNRFAHAAALAIAEAPAEAYNPLFIYGGAGLGKTHLLHAIGRYVTECHPHLVVRYVSTEQFMNEFIASLQRRTIPDFHGRYRDADVLLMDDIQFLEGKERTQEEFFHTFNALHPHSQIVISSDRPPKRISTLEERLRTRFHWGLITDIQPPDLETRLAILQKKAETEHLHAPPDVLSFIASRIQTNIRELEGALIRITAYASLTRSELSIELAKQVLQTVLPDSPEARVTPDLIISIAAEYFDFTPDEIRSSSRSRSLVNARQTSMYLSRELTDLSLPKIGERFGKRDHSTVIHAIDKVRKQSLAMSPPGCRR